MRPAKRYPKFLESLFHLCLISEKKLNLNSTILYCGLLRYQRFILNFKPKNEKFTLEGICSADSEIISDFVGFYNLIQLDLKNPNKNIRCICLKILPLATEMSFKEDFFLENRLSDITVVISRFMNDPHPEVRKTAINELVNLHYSHNSLSIELYDPLVIMCKDESESVRLSSLDLLSILAEIFKNENVTITQSGDTEEMRLIDSSFVTICDMVNDISVLVRKKAFEILGKYKNVDPKFLLQTFSKQKTHIPTPGGDLDEGVYSEEFHLLESGAAGAFVHGLEDDFQEVRNAAIDMFNDSSDRARMNSIKTLTKIGYMTIIDLTEEQLSIALSSMEDSSPSIRHELHKFLSVSRVKDSSEMLTLVSSLHLGIKSHPEDTASIFNTLSKIGKNNASVIGISFIHKSETSLLSLNFYTSVPPIDNTANIILIINAAVLNLHPIMNDLPTFIYSHIPYFVKTSAINMLKKSPVSIEDSTQLDKNEKKEFVKNYSQCWKIIKDELNLLKSADLESSPTTQSFWRSRATILHRSIRRFFYPNNNAECFGSLIEELESFSGDIDVPTFKKKLLILSKNLIKNYSFEELDDNQNVLRIYAVITTPISINPIEYNYLFPFSITINAELHNVNLFKIKNEKPIILNDPLFEPNLLKNKNPSFSHNYNSQIEGVSLLTFENNDNSKSLPSLNETTHDQALEINSFSHIGALVTFPNSQISLIGLPGHCFKKEFDDHNNVFWKIEAKISVNLPVSAGEVGNLSISIVRFITESYNFNDSLGVGVQNSYTSSVSKKTPKSMLWRPHAESLFDTDFPKNISNLNPNEKLVQIVDITEKTYLIKLIPKIMKSLAY
ncbi:Integrator complex subunit 4 [Smittium mucronatum]|uniref:Integrator complex subunit 4 n=1 Tax=Smittium mucronatum TaxID=133383 RepID=A0A1R0GV27_9FUNG|nr:Integrator complex subunit 4 [Smittium mucronatum]